MDSKNNLEPGWLGRAIERNRKEMEELRKLPKWMQDAMGLNEPHKNPESYKETWPYDCDHQ